jgi:hypothetical protein
MTTRTVTGAAYWASYFINGDASGLVQEEKNWADAWIARELEPGEDIVDCGEPYFTRHYGLHTGTPFSGGDVVDYTVLKRA